MIRKTLLALAAAGTLALGMTSMVKPAAADINIRIGTGFGYHHGYYYGHRNRCKIRTVRVWRNHHWVLRKVRVCNRYRRY